MKLNRALLNTRCHCGWCSDAQLGATPVAAFCVVAAGQRNRREQTLGGDADSQQRRTGRGCATGCAETYRMVLSVRRRIHCGIGRFCFCFFPKMRLILNDLWDGCGASNERRESSGHAGAQPVGSGGPSPRARRAVAEARRDSSHRAKPGAGTQRAKSDSASGRRAPAPRRAAHGAAHAASCYSPAGANGGANPRAGRTSCAATGHRGAGEDAPWFRTRRARKGRLYRLTTGTHATRSCRRSRSQRPGAAARQYNLCRPQDERQTRRSRCFVTCEPATYIHQTLTRQLRAHRHR